jgi:hypothetical protein
MLQTLAAISWVVWLLFGIAAVTGIWSWRRFAMASTAMGGTALAWLLAATALGSAGSGAYLAWHELFPWHGHKPVNISDINQVVDPGAMLLANGGDSVFFVAHSKSVTDSTVEWRVYTWKPASPCATRQLSPAQLPGKPLALAVHVPNCRALVIYSDRVLRPRDQNDGWVEVQPPTYRFHAAANHDSAAFVLGTDQNNQLVLLQYQAAQDRLEEVARSPAGPQFSQELVAMPGSDAVAFLGTTAGVYVRPAGSATIEHKLAHQQISHLSAANSCCYAATRELNENGDLSLGLVRIDANGALQHHSLKLGIADRILGVAILQEQIHVLAGKDTAYQIYLINQAGFVFQQELKHPHGRQITDPRGFVPLATELGLLSGEADFWNISPLAGGTVYVPKITGIRQGRITTLWPFQGFALTAADCLTHCDATTRKSAIGLALWRQGNGHSHLK